ncbi:Protein translocase subunit SecA 2 [Candidatus Sulfopaludibacter sp. SbA6]|nr:Protein translocase subunit SecA 2 [Candidatus Sulfopaludibacter sp. SbA6]
MKLLRSWFAAPSAAGEVARINQQRAGLANLDDESLRQRFHKSKDLLEVVAIVAVVASRVLSLQMFDVQLRGALSLARGRIAEMQTGEGKTLACTPAVAWHARSGGAIHVMTVNDYLARRDARWMGGIYQFLGLSVGCIQQTMGIEERGREYHCDITYATANEVGFDFLRDQIAMSPAEQVHRPFHAALIDEADSILIDEARIPLILAGGEQDEETLARRAGPVARRLQLGTHFTLDEYGRNIALTDEGIRVVESALRCANIFAEPNLPLYTAVHNAIHAHALLRRDVDYVVKNGAIESVDQFKGRIAQDRRWPAGLHTAIEAKEGVPFRRQGRVLGSITLQNLVALYPKVCGMTGTAATQSEEFRTCYGLEVEVIPTNRPVIRIDEPDRLFDTRLAKEQAVVEEIGRVHSTGQPILVGTASVEESERLSAALSGIAHFVLNARNEEEEAGIVARAGQRGAVTISTNMAGRGVDIQLGEAVAALGGLYVLGMNRHESRRIDHQLRGRAGRQGDPGRSRFFISREDDLLVRYGIQDEKYQHDAESIQRLVEGQNLDIRKFLVKYESVIEGQRQRIQERRQAILASNLPDLERIVSLSAIDDLWSDHLAAISELRSGVQWYSWSGRDPLHEYLTRVDTAYRELEDGLDSEISARLAEAQAKGLDPSERGATWTYLTTDRPFGEWNERILRGLVRKVRKRDLWG